MKEIVKSKENEKDSLIVMILFAVLLMAPAFIQSLIDLGQHKQLIIGTLVNCALFLSSVYMKDTKKVIALSVLPSVSNILTGILFEGMTQYAKIMIPFIWLGNLAIIYGGRLLRSRFNFTISSVISIIVKVSIIYGGFVLMSNILDFPDKIVKVMGSTMGVMQLYTGISGLVLSIILFKIKDNKFKLF